MPINSLVVEYREVVVDVVVSGGHSRGTGLLYANSSKIEYVLYQWKNTIKLQCNR